MKLVKRLSKVLKKRNRKASEVYSKILKLKYGLIHNISLRVIKRIAKLNEKFLNSRQKTKKVILLPIVKPQMNE